MISFFILIVTLTLTLGLYTATHDTDLRKADEIQPGMRRAIHNAMTFCIACEVVLFILLLFRPGS